jgi:hypothetical protein
MSISGNLFLKKYCYPNKNILTKQVADHDAFFTVNSPVQLFKRQNSYSGAAGGNDDASAHEKSRRHAARRLVSNA